MPHYKDNENLLYFFTDEDVALGWPHQSTVKLVPISDEEAQAMLSALIPTPTAAELTRRQIAELEAQQTDRRIREAVLGIDGGWLANLNIQISALREQMKTINM